MLSKRKLGIILTVGAAITALAALAAVQVAAAGTFGAPFDAAEKAQIRQAAVDAGLGAAVVAANPYGPNAGDFNDLGDFLVDTSPATKAKLAQLGKALFWDQQVGSDGQACASCHFSAGADNRAINQLNPGLRVEPVGDTTFQRTKSGDPGGPNYTLVNADFPVEVNDVTSSQGVFTANFVSTTVGQRNDNGIAVFDPIFNVAGVNTRFVEPRNTPTTINAIFNVSNFWDGRAHPKFNGVSPIGPLDAGAAILVNPGDGSLVSTNISIPDSSLASQAVGPVLSNAEMSFSNRTFPDVGKKLLNPATVPLGFQAVHPQDSALGPLANAAPTKGLNTTYASLIQQVFQPRFWNSTNLTTVTRPDNTTGQFNQMQMNFSLFWGNAVQAYETSLVFDQGLQSSTPIDRFMAGNDNALTDDQLEGLLVFINTGESLNPVFEGVSQGMCSECHFGPEFTQASFTSLADQGGKFLKAEQGVDDGLNPDPARIIIRSLGFSNIGVRPTTEDPGRGSGNQTNGANNFPFPLSFARQAQAGLPFAPEPLPAGTNAQTHAAVDGAVKTSGLRNIALTAPYMHNGGQNTLAQVVRFYQRRGDFSRENFLDIEADFAAIKMRGGDEDILVAFMEALTDSRVVNESAPFDHPEIVLPNGHPGDNVAITDFNLVNGVNVAEDSLFTLPATGSNGSQLPITPFPNLLPTGFSVALQNGWNLLSTPVLLAANKDTPADIFDPVSQGNIEIAFAFANGQFVQVTNLFELKPLDAIFVKVKPASTAFATLDSEPGLSTPPTKALVAGLNLIGPAPVLLNGNFQTQSLDQALITIAQAGTATGYTAVVSPGLNQPSWVFAIGGPLQNLLPNKGYWVVMENPDTLIGFSTTPIVP